MKRTISKMTKNSGFWMFLSVVAVLLFIYILFPNITAITASLTGGAMTLPGEYEQGALPPAQTSCSQYHLYDEYVAYLGQPNMNAIQSSCMNNGGRFTGLSNQVGCGYPSAVTFDCQQPVLLILSNFCTYLKATWVCDNNLHYVGCVCQTSPVLYEGAQEEQEEQQEEYTCAFQEVPLLWGQCGGTCPSGTSCELITSQECACVEDTGYVYGSVGSVFATKNKWSGAMGGLSGMDNKCQVSANSAGLSGTWIAIAGDTSVNPNSRVVDTKYYLLNGELVANNKADLFDGSILTSLNVDEYGDKVSDSAVWTNSYADGTRWSNFLPNTCHNWAWVSEGYIGGIGTTNANNNFWINTGSGQACSLSARIYCMRVS